MSVQEDNNSQAQHQLATPPITAPSSEGSSPTAAGTANAAQAKRKPSRRANTAERRATHNAVERARRETLNGRFLDLAGLLPNLSQIRRPSKSAIVNSSIAHIHASRRHRLSAARELRLLKGEADALRRELNEWRDRAALPRIEEPQRGEGFSMVLSGELEVINIGPQDEDDEDGEPLYETGSQSDNTSNSQQQQQQNPQQQQQSQNQNQQPFYHELDAQPNASMYAHQGPPTPPTSSHGHSGSHAQQMQQQMMHRQQQQHMHPMIVNSQQVHFDPAHPANMHGMPQFHPSHGGAVNYAHHHQLEAPRSVVDEKTWAMRGAYGRSPAISYAPQNNGGWADIHGDDHSSVSSGGGGRARSGSLSTNGFGSPPRSPGHNFDLGGYTDANYDLSSNGEPGSYGSGGGIPRGLTVNTSGLGPHGNMMGMPSPVGNGAGGGFGNVMMGHMM